MEELDSGFQIIEGKKPVLIVAGHNFRQGREGKMKAADMGTGEITRKLCDRYNFWGIVSTRKQLDPNWYSNSHFREKVKEIIKVNGIDLVIDIHGKSLAANNLIELKGNTWFKKKYQPEVDYFIKNEQMTLAEDLDKPTLQIEIREDGRVRTIDEVKYTEAQKLLNELMGKLIYEN